MCISYKKELRPALRQLMGMQGRSFNSAKRNAIYLRFVLRAAFGFAAAFERAFFTVFFLRAVIGMRE